MKPGVRLAPLVSLLLRTVWKPWLQLIDVEPEPAASDVYSHTSPGSSRPSRSVSPTLNDVPDCTTGMGVKSSAGLVGVPASSRIDMTFTGASPSSYTWYVQTAGVPTGSAWPGAVCASSSFVGFIGFLALSAFRTR